MVERGEVRLGWGVRPLVGVVSLLLCTTLACRSAAQTGPDFRREPSPAASAAGEASRSAPSRRDSLDLFAGRDVAFDEVLRDPDNVALNYAFALTQIRGGDLLGALATLERILLKQPNLPRVRLVYAIVLYRLNAVAEASREFDNLLRLRMDEGLRRELEYYRGQIGRAKRTTKFSAIVQFGWNYDSNRNAAPLSRAIASSGAFVALPGEIDTHSLEGLARVEVEHDLGLPRRHRLIGSATGFYDHSLRADRFSLGAAEIRGGVALDLAPQELKIQPHLRWVHLDNDTLLRAYGGTIRFDWQTKRDVLLFVQGSGEYQAFNATDQGPSSRFRSGAEWRGGAGVRWAVVPEHRLTFTATAIRKEAREGFFDYAGALAGVEHAWLLGRGMFLLTNVSWEGDWYDEADPNINSTRREDHILRVRAVFGIPFSTLTGWSAAPRPLRDLGISIGFEYTRAFSNVDNYRYHNYRVTGALTKRFDF